jgi:CheY-like chemotaxis protein
MNLYSNAAHAMRGRSGAIAVSAALVARGALRAPGPGIETEPGGAVRLTAGEIRADAAYVVVAVSDDGAGMGREVLERILDPFFTTKGRGEGTGLGIPVVHGIMLSHGGALSIRSKAGAYTTVELWFPAADVEAAEDTAAAEDRSRARVLIIDDEETFAEMLATGLERLGYSTVAANDPLAGLQAFRRAPASWDAVVTDQNMPAMTGLELVERIKQLRPVVPCIVCSGNAAALSETVVRAAGGDAFLRKPVDPSALAKVIEGLLAIRRASAA